MDRADLIALASPPCHECGESVQRVETRWHLDDDRTLAARAGLPGLPRRTSRAGRAAGLSGRRREDSPAGESLARRRRGATVGARVIRIELTDEDFSRTRLALSPLWELVASLFLLHRDEPPAEHGPGSSGRAARSPAARTSGRST